VVVSLGLWVKASAMCRIGLEDLDLDVSPIPLAAGWPSTDDDELPARPLAAAGKGSAPTTRRIVGEAHSKMQGSHFSV